MIVGHPRRIAPVLTHDDGWIPHGSIYIEGLERMRRIELPSSAWRAVALPLSYIRVTDCGAAAP